MLQTKQQHLLKTEHFRNLNNSEYDRTSAEANMLKSNAQPLLNSLQEQFCPSERSSAFSLILLLFQLPALILEYLVSFRFPSSRRQEVDS